MFRLVTMVPALNLILGIVVFLLEISEENTWFHFSSERVGENV